MGPFHALKAGCPSCACCPGVSFAFRGSPQQQLILVDDCCSEQVRGFGRVQKPAKNLGKTRHHSTSTSFDMVKPTPSSTLSRELRRIGTSWPPDILRPRLQYGIYLAALSESQNITPRMVRASQLLLENKLKEKVRSFHNVFQPFDRSDV